MATRAEVIAWIRAHDDTGKATKSAKQNVDSIGDSIKKLQTLIQGLVIVKAFQKISEAVGKCNEAFGEAELSAIRLDSAARNNPMLNGNFTENMTDFASEMQFLVGISDEAIKNQIAFAGSLGRSEDEIKKITRAAADLAAGTHLSFESAFRNIVKTFSGMSGELGEVIPGLSKLGKEAMQSGAAVEFIGEKFKGLAAQAMGGLAGSRKALDLAMGDLAESVGQFTAPLEKAWNNLWAGVAESMSQELNKGFDKADPDAWLREIMFGIQRIQVQVNEFFTNLGRGLKHAFNSVFYAIETELIKIKMGWQQIFDPQQAQKTAREYMARLTGGGPKLDWNYRASEAMTQAYKISQGTGGYAAGEQYMRTQIAREKDPETRAFMVQALAQLKGLQIALPKALKESGGAGGGIGGAGTAAAENTQAIIDALHELPGEMPGFGMGAAGMPVIAPSSAREGMLFEGQGEGMTKFLDDLTSFFHEGFTPIFEEIFAGFGPFGEILSIVVDLFSEFANIMDVLNPVMTVLTAAVSVFGPILNSILAPLANALKTMGQIIGALIVPLLKILAPVIEVVMTAFKFLYNAAIRPIANAIIFAGKIIYNIVAWIYNAVATIINFLLGWLGVHMKKMKYENMEKGYLGAIKDEGSLTGEGGTTGQAAQYTQGRTVNIYLNIYTDVMVGDMRELALAIRQELRSAEALGA